MTIGIKCNCGAEYRLDDSRGGKRFICKVCSAIMDVPAGVPRVVPAGVPQIGEAIPIKTSQHASQAPSAAQAAPAPAAAGAAATAAGEAAASGETARSYLPREARAATMDAMRARSSGRHPPRSWWVTRFIMWAVCIAFLFMPWLSASVRSCQVAESVTMSVSGWRIARGTVEAISGNPAEAWRVACQPGDVNAPPGMQTAGVGATMMGFGPCVYVLGLLAALVVAYFAYHRDGQGALWPFLICWLGLLVYIIGWQLIAKASAVGEALTVAKQSGASIGVAGWAYLMLMILIPICLIAKARPDYALADAIRWSQEKAKTGN